MRCLCLKPPCGQAVLGARPFFVILTHGGPAVGFEEILANRQTPLESDASPTLFTA